MKTLAWILTAALGATAPIALAGDGGKTCEKARSDSDPKAAVPTAAAACAETGTCQKAASCREAGGCEACEKTCRLAQQTDRATQARLAFAGIETSLADLLARSTSSAAQDDGDLQVRLERIERMIEELNAELAQRATKGERSEESDDDSGGETEEHHRLHRSSKAIIVGPQGISAVPGGGFRWRSGGSEGHGSNRLHGHGKITVIGPDGERKDIELKGIDLGHFDIEDLGIDLDDMDVDLTDAAKLALGLVLESDEDAPRVEKRVEVRALHAPHAPHASHHERDAAHLRYRVGVGEHRGLTDEDQDIHVIESDHGTYTIEIGGDEDEAARSPSAAAPTPPPVPDAPAERMAELTELLRAMRTEMREMRAELRDLREELRDLRSEVR